MHIKKIIYTIITLILLLALKSTFFPKVLQVLRINKIHYSSFDRQSFQIPNVHIKINFVYL